MVVGSSLLNLTILDVSRGGKIFVVLGRAIKIGLEELGTVVCATENCGGLLLKSSRIDGITDPRFRSRIFRTRTRFGLHFSLQPSRIENSIRYYPYPLLKTYMILAHLITSPADQWTFLTASQRSGLD